MYEVSMINEFIFLALNIIIKYVGKHNGKHILRMHKESYNETIHFKTTCGGDAVLKKTSISLSFIASLIFKNIKVSLLIVPFWTVFCRYLLFFSLYNQLSTSTTTFGQAPIKASLITKGDMENIWSIMPDFRFCQTFTVVNVNSLSVKYYRYFITSINLQRNSYPPAWLIFLIKLMRSTFLRHSTTRSRRVIAVY